MVYSNSIEVLFKSHLNIALIIDLNKLKFKLLKRARNNNK